MGRQAGRPTGSRRQRGAGKAAAGRASRSAAAHFARALEGAGVTSHHTTSHRNCSPCGIVQHRVASPIARHDVRPQLQKLLHHLPAVVPNGHAQRCDTTLVLSVDIRTGCGVGLNRRGIARLAGIVQPAGRLRAAADAFSRAACERARQPAGRQGKMSAGQMSATL